MAETLADELRLYGARHQAGAKILTIDIERLPGLARAFDSKVDYIRPSQWVEPPRTICWAARWYGEKEPQFAAEWLDVDDMVEWSWELYDEADAVITYNGIRFDNKHLKTMWMEAGLPMPSPWKDIDLLPVARQFGYVSKSLDYVAKQLGHPGKVDKYDPEVAEAAVNGDRDAQQRLAIYNIGDVETTEWLHDRWLGWMPTHPHIGPPQGDTPVCNQCSSTELTLQPSTYRAVRIDYALYRCENCGANVKGAWVARAARTGTAR